MSTSADLARQHWNETPLYYTEDYRYKFYPWLYDAAEFRRHIGERVLEVGCGTGTDLLQFARHGAIATGVDITEQHLRLARERVRGKAEVLYGDATNLPFPDGSFDYVYSHGVLHHIDRANLAATEILRVLKPDGRFNVHLYARYSYMTWWLISRKRRAWKLHIENSLTPVYVELYTARKVRRFFPGCRLSFQKFQTPEYKRFERYIGWFLVTKGLKP